jgi:hypothetical protein
LDWWSFLEEIWRRKKFQTELQFFSSLLKEQIKIKQVATSAPWSLKLRALSAHYF